MIVEALAALAIQNACLSDGDRIRGELRYVETKHQNGALMRSAFLVTSDPVCVDDEFGRSEGKWVQLVSVDPQAFASIPMGSTIVVQVEDFATPMTAWHFGDIVAFGTRVVGFELQ